jgi:phosphoserine phosphatase
MNENIAFFDFDKTIIKKDTLRPFALYISRIKNNSVLFYVFILFFLFFKLRLLSNKKLKNVFLKLFFDGYSLEELKELILKFEDSFVRNNLNHNVFLQFINYIESGNKVFVISSNLEIFLKHLTILRNANIIATEVQYSRENNTYKLQGNVCRGSEKIKRLKWMFGDLIFEEAMFYGDKEDKLLLKTFKKSIQV